MTKEAENKRYNDLMQSIWAQRCEWKRQHIEPQKVLLSVGDEEFLIDHVKDSVYGTQIDKGKATCFGLTVEIDETLEDGKPSVVAPVRYRYKTFNVKYPESGI